MNLRTAQIIVYTFVLTVCLLDVAYGAEACMAATAQQLALPAFEHDALMRAYQRTELARLGISFARAMATRAIAIALRNLAHPRSHRRGKRHV